MSLQACLSRPTFTLQLETPLKTVSMSAPKDSRLKFEPLIRLIRSLRLQSAANPSGFMSPSNPNNVHLGAWRGWAGGRGYAHSPGSWKLFLQRRGWGAARNGSSNEWEVRRWRPTLQKVSLRTGARAEPARNGVFVALSALVPGMGKEGVALCCEKRYMSTCFPR